MIRFFRKLHRRWRQGKAAIRYMTRSLVDGISTMEYPICEVCGLGAAEASLVKNKSGEEWYCFKHVPNSIAATSAWTP